MDVVSLLELFFLAVEASSSVCPWIDLAYSKALLNNFDFMEG